MKNPKGIFSLKVSKLFGLKIAKEILMEFLENGILKES